MTARPARRTTSSRPSRRSSTRRPPRPARHQCRADRRGRGRSTATVVFKLCRRLRRPAGGARLSPTPRSSRRRSSRATSTSLSRDGDRHRAVQAGLLRAGPADRRRAQRRLLRPGPALSRPRRDRSSIRIATAEASALIVRRHRPHRRRRRRPSSARLQKAGGVKALRVPSGQFLQRQLRLRPEAVQRRPRAPGAGADRRPRGDGRLRRRGLRHAGQRHAAELRPTTSTRSMPLQKPDIAKAKQLLAEAGYPNGHRR